MTQTLSVVRSEIAKLGAQFNPDILASTRVLYSGLVSVPSWDIKTEFDIAYGSNPRQMLDLYSADGTDIRPVMLFVPGGGFTSGDKRMDNILLRQPCAMVCREGIPGNNRELPVGA
jgi:acetyl esterase/lipase